MPATNWVITVKKWQKEKEKCEPHPDIWQLLWSLRSWPRWWNWMRCPLSGRKNLYIFQFSLSIYLIFQFTFYYRKKKKITFLAWKNSREEEIRGKRLNKWGMVVNLYLEIENPGGGFRKKNRQNENLMLTTEIKSGFPARCRLLSFDIFIRRSTRNFFTWFGKEKGEWKEEKVCSKGKTSRRLSQISFSRINWASEFVTFPLMRDDAHATLHHPLNPLGYLSCPFLLALRWKCLISPRF